MKIDASCPAMRTMLGHRAHARAPSHRLSAALAVSPHLHRQPVLRLRALRSQKRTARRGRTGAHDAVTQSPGTGFTCDQRHRPKPRLGAHCSTISETSQMRSIFNATFFGPGTAGLSGWSPSRPALPPGPLANREAGPGRDAPGAVRAINQGDMMQNNTNRGPRKIKRTRAAEPCRAVLCAARRSKGDTRVP